MIEVVEVLSQTVKPLWIERKELWDNQGGDTKTIEMHSGYSVVDGAYCGSIDSRDGMFKFFARHSIKPEKRTPDSNICSIGFSEAEQKWYGWSHRAIFGFGIGSEVKKGDCAYMPTDKEDFKADCVRFWDHESHLEATGKEEEFEEEDGARVMGVRVSWVYDDSVPNEKLRGKVSSVFSPYPEEFGRGEWTAETLDDARQMACNFAEGVN